MARSRSKQTIFDLALQGYGRMDELVKLARENNLSLSDEITAGTDVDFDTNASFGNNNVKNFVKKDNRIFNNYYETYPEDGIGAWIIEDTFIVQ